MASESVSSVDCIEIDKEADFGISGLFRVLSRRNYEATHRFSDLGKLTDIELRTVANQSNNAQVAILSGLRTVGDLASSFDTDKSNFDHLGVGWLVKHLAETLEAVLEIDSSACMELAERGYNSIGQPIRRRIERGSPA